MVAAIKRRFQNVMTLCSICSLKISTYNIHRDIKKHIFICLKYNNKAVSINNNSLSYITKYTALFRIILPTNI